MNDGELSVLLRDALASHEDSKERWELVRALQARADRATFDALAAWLMSDDPTARMIAADALGQFGVGGEPTTGASSNPVASVRPFKAEAIEMINVRLATEVHPGALQAAIHAAAHLGHPSAIPLLVARREHGDAFVRWALVNTLAGFDHDAAVGAVIGFLGDPSALVRDWAAFAFGVTLTERDSPEIRAALLPLVNDEDPIARSEALRALALRGVDTEEVIQGLLATLAVRGELENLDPLDDAVLLVAATTADPRLREAVLIQLREWDELCDGEPPEPPSDLLLDAVNALAGD